jgi:cholesterol oxidase
VLVIEKGRRFSKEDFPRSNWHLRKWLWIPFLRFFGFFKITLFRHITVLSGVGVGGGSLVYANTLAVPKQEFFHLPAWAKLAHWEKELKPFYKIALQMLGAAINPRLESGDLALAQIATELGKKGDFEATRVAVYFGQPEKEVKDPYFKGKGPDRSGCNFCGGCMVGCRFNAKNTLDKNYLYLAEKGGTQILAESEVYNVQTLSKIDGSEGYRVFWKSSHPTILSLFRKKRGSASCKGIIFAGGVLGTVPLLLKLKKKSLFLLSDLIGKQVRTNSESLMGITTFDKAKDFSKGIAIGSIFHTDEHSHLEPVRYPSGSGFWRILTSPQVHGANVLFRLVKIFLDYLRSPLENLKVYFVRNWAEKTQILLFMRTLDSTLTFRRKIFGMGSFWEQGEKPTAFMEEARNLAQRFAEKVNGKPTVLLTETLLGIPTTAHILGGAVMGANKKEGVIDRDNRVFGYQEMYICDGSMISANPGVNPSLTITALSERAMSKIPVKGGKIK